MQSALIIHGSDTLKSTMNCEFRDTESWLADENTKFVFLGTSVGMAVGSMSIGYLVLSKVSIEKHHI